MRGIVSPLQRSDSRRGIHTNGSDDSHERQLQRAHSRAVSAAHGRVRTRHVVPSALSGERWYRPSRVTLRRAARLLFDQAARILIETQRQTASDVVHRAEQFRRQPARYRPP
jgi:hypothetical protein